VEILYFTIVSAKSVVAGGDEEKAILFPVKVLAKAK